MEDDLLTTGEVAKRLRVTTATLKNWRRRGQGPPWTKVGPAVIRYPAASLEAWLLQREARADAASEAEAS